MLRALIHYRRVTLAVVAGAAVATAVLAVGLVLRIRLYRESALAILSGVFALTLLSGLYPAWRAYRTRPAEALRYE